MGNPSMEFEIFPVKIEPCVLLTYKFSLVIVDGNSVGTALGDQVMAADGVRAIVVLTGGQGNGEEREVGLRGGGGATLHLGTARAVAIQ